MKQNFINFHKSVMLIAVSILLASCGRNIPSLQAVETTVEEFNGAAEFLSSDMYESCIRATQFAGTPASPTVFTQRQPKEKYCHDNFKEVSTQTAMMSIQRLANRLKNHCFRNIMSIPWQYLEMKLKR